jgi:hypothetical protein
MSKAHLVGAALLGAPLLLGVSACGSQIAGLKPVGGDTVYQVRVASIDVLLDANVVMKSVPSCEQEAVQVTCTGSTLDGVPITVTSPGSRADDMSVTVGDKTIYQGPVMEILNKHASAP